MTQCGARPACLWLPRHAAVAQTVPHDRTAAADDLITTVINVPCVSMWALFGVAIRRALTDARRRRVFNVIMAASLLILALTFIA